MLQAVMFALAFLCVDLPPERPPVTDLDWLPPAYLAEANYEQSIKYFWEIDAQVQGRKPIQWPHNERTIEDLRRSADLCSDAWLFLNEAHKARARGNDFMAQRYLATLRERVGWQRYYSAELLPPIPYWHFKRLD